MSANNQDTVSVGLIFIGLIFLSFCLFIFDRSNATGIPFFVLMKTSLFLIFVFGGFAYMKHLGVSASLLYPAISVLTVISLFPILNHYALLASEKVFHETTDFLGRTKHELTAVEITVFWASFAMKALYVAIAMGIGILAQRIFHPDENWF